MNVRPEEKSAERLIGAEVNGDSKVGSPFQRSVARWIGIELARAFGGALLFTLPTLMTQEMWYLGFYMNPDRLVLYLILGFPMLVGLSHYAGFHETFRWKDDARDAFIGYLVALITAAGVLYALGVIETGLPASEILGKIALQAVPGGIGALLARTQLGGSTPDQEQKRRETRLGGELFIMSLGALVLSFNIAPTEEIVFISQILNAWHAAFLVVLSIALMHAFVYGADFHGQARVPPGTPQWSEFIRFTVLGYAVVIGISLYVLWTFGRLDGVALSQVAFMGVVLGFPASIGAAAARLII
jgi:putative integral membrane protein (TIGR02587 family)